MKAVIQKTYGSPEVLEVKELEAPQLGDHEILIRVRATSVTAVDCTFRKGSDFFARLFTGLIKPKHPVPGGEFAGVVAAVGKSVTAFKPGDEVFGPTADGFGAQAELLLLSEEAPVARKPPALSHEQAAVLSYGGLTALPFMRDEAKVQSGQHVLVNGASGPVGATAVQLAKLAGAEVTGVCSTPNLEFVRSLGADHVVDYTREDFTDNDGAYDVIFDPAGKSSFSRCKDSLTDTGVYLSAALSLGILLQSAWTSILGKKRARIALTGMRSPTDKKKDIAVVTALVESGRLKFPIGVRYPIERIVEAHHRVEHGHASGNVVVTVDAN
jgi:NADPH:quinone reductase-like Zn-dependent oxidoreductase